MMLSQTKLIAAVVFLSGVATAGTGVLTYQSPLDKATADAPRQAAKGPPTQPHPVEDRLHTVLSRWHEEVEKIQNVTCQVTRTDRDKQFHQTSVFEGTFKYLKPKMMILELREKGDAQKFEKWISNGKNLHQYALERKEVVVYELPHARPAPPQKRPWFDFLGATLDFCQFFICGAKPEDAKRRYELKLDKESEWYIYVMVAPRSKVGKANLEQARVVLLKESFLPRQVWWKYPNGDETTWDITHLNCDAKLTRDDFKVSVPEGWRLVRLTNSSHEKEKEEK